MKRELKNRIAAIVVLASASAMLAASPAQAELLLNPGFENGSGGNASDWNEAVNGFLAERSTSTPNSGSYSFKFAVNGDQTGNGANNANLSQTVSTGDISNRDVYFSGYVRHNSDEPLIGPDQKLEFRLYWRHNGTALSPSFVTNTVLTPSDVTDEYLYYRMHAVAPATTNQVIAQVIFRTGTTVNSSITTGAAYVDDLSLLAVPEPGTIVLAISCLLALAPMVWRRRRR